jgi:hypothetical protein
MDCSSACEDDDEEDDDEEEEEEDEEGDEKGTATGEVRVTPGGDACRNLMMPVGRRRLRRATLDA